MSSYPLAFDFTDSVQLYLPPCSFSYMPSRILPLGLGISFLCLEYFAPDIYIIYPISSFKSMLKSYFTRDVFTDHSIKDSNMPPTPNSRLLASLLLFFSTAVITTWHIYMFICLFSVYPLQSIRARNVVHCYFPYS